MAIPKRIINFLDKSEVRYNILNHKKIYTALDKARTLKTKESLVVKTVILKADKDILFALIPANKIIDIDKLVKIIDKKKEKKTKKINFVKEKWIKEHLKGVKIGVIPPFGNLWNLPVFLDKDLLKGAKIILNSGDHQYSIEIISSKIKTLIPDIIEGVFSKKKSKTK